MFPQQSAHFATHIICQRRNRFGGYLRKEGANAHIDGKIDCNVCKIVQIGAVKAIVEEYVQVGMFFLFIGQKYQQIQSRQYPAPQNLSLYIVFLTNVPLRKSAPIRW